MKKIVTSIINIVLHRSEKKEEREIWFVYTLVNLHHIDKTIVLDFFCMLAVRKYAYAQRRILNSEL